MIDRYQLPEVRAAFDRYYANGFDVLTHAEVSLITTYLASIDSAYVERDLARHGEIRDGLERVHL